MAIANAAHIGSKGQSCSPAGPIQLVLESGVMTIGPAAPELTAHLLDDRLTLARRPGARYTQPMVLVEGRKQRRVDR